MIEPNSSLLASFDSAQDRPHSSLRILGIDPGSNITGFGVIVSDSRRLTYVASGAIRVGETELSARLKTILEGVREIIANHHPDLIAVEQVFVNINPQSTLALGQARGAAICAAVLNDLPVFEYTALQVKQAVVGNGHASKEQVQQMVCRLLSLSGKPSNDAADALACAICHANAKSGAFANAGLRVRKGRLV